MHTPPFAFLFRTEGGTARIPREWAQASDWFVIFTLITLLFLLGCFAVWAWIIWRRTTRPKPHIQLLMELEDEAKSESQTANHAGDEDESRAPWEQSPDWWKKADD